MKQLFTILLLCQVMAGLGQGSFKTIVPTQPVVAGESFQVQYVVEDGDKTMNVKPPVFSNFRVVAGPAIYLGSVSASNGTRSLRNVVYTLEAIIPGRFMIPGATVIVNGKPIRSNNAFVEVIAKEEAARRYNKESGISSDYFLRPGEDPYEKIRKNLFVRVMVDKKNCYTGEPVQATFKLYSRLESKSDIVKNPGFYGFTVYDIENLADKQTSIEKINGQVFDVHTIRKVQLYPLQAGDFTVDAMQVRNRVEFSRSAVSKKTEQEIVEGVLGERDKSSPATDADLFETNISTEPLTIHVKPVPEKNRPASFEGATGNFGINASLVKNDLSKNEEGYLEITISGKGNFIQLSAPSVQWPEGIEAFDPVIKDNFDKTTTPLSGKRIFRYTFISARDGSFKLSPVTFSFFDTDSNQFKTISTTPLEWQVRNDAIKQYVQEETKIPIAEKSEKAARIAAGIIVLLVLVIVGYWISRKKEPGSTLPLQQVPDLPSHEKLLEPALILVAGDSNRFYSILHGIIWRFAASRFGLSGSEMNKKLLVEKMDQAQLPPGLASRLLHILEECETGMYTGANLLHDRQSMLDDIKEVFGKISSGE